MKRILFSLIVLAVIAVASAQIPPADLQGEDFRTWIRDNFYRGQHRSLRYRPARRAMYNFIDNYDNSVVGVYGGLRRSVTFGGNLSNPGPINAEHTVPQSFFNEREPMKSDLHHLFPTYSRWNRTRDNHPFREIPDDKTTKWMVFDCYQAIQPSSKISSNGCQEQDSKKFSEYAYRSFEPREDHKGNVARAVFYFYTMYPDFDITRVGSIHTFYAWHLADQVDDRERRRNDEIQDRQGNRNPFIDNQEWVRRAWPSIRLSESRAVLDLMGLDIPLEDADVALVDVKPTDEIRVHSLNVGAGSCHVIECPGTNAAPIPYDCGRLKRSDPDLTKNEVVDYVQGILDRYSADPIVIVSHADRDHYRYIPAIMANRKTATVWFGGFRDHYQGEMDAWLDGQAAQQVPLTGGLDDLPEGFSNNGNAVAQLACGTAETFVLTVNAGNSKNARSLMARIEHGDFSVTLTGDATGATQQSASANFSDITTTVATGCHHGAITHGSNSSNWANALQPEIIIFSSGTSFEHPRCDAIEAYGSNLLDVNEHQIWCGDSQGYRDPFTTTKAEYVTRINGVVIVASDGDDSREVNCSLSSDCGS